MLLNSESIEFFLFVAFQTSAIDFNFEYEYDCLFIIPDY